MERGRYAGLLEVIRLMDMHDVCDLDQVMQGNLLSTLNEVATEDNMPGCWKTYSRRNWWCHIVLCKLD